MKIPTIALLLATCLPAVATRAQDMPGMPAFIEYFLYDDVYDEKLKNDRVYFGVGIGGDYRYDPVQLAKLGYQKTILGKVSGGAVVAGGMYGFSGSLEVLLRFRRASIFRPLIYAGPTFATGARFSEMLCVCDDETWPPPDGYQFTYARTVYTTYPSLFATTGAGLQIGSWRGFGVEYRFGWHAKLLGKDPDFTSAPEVDEAARDNFQDLKSTFSLTTNFFYEF